MSSYIVPKHRCTTPRVNPQIHCGPWVLTTCQCRFILGYRYTPLANHVNSGEDYACLGPTVYMYINVCIYFCLFFSYFKSCIKQ